VTDEEILIAARDVVWGELREMSERERRGGSGYDPKPRVTHLNEVAAGLDRLIREQHEAYR
jgi:hypothetical protein